MQFILLLIASYFLGSVSFSYIIARAKGKDLSKFGSGNLGGTNMGRAFGARWGALVGILDVLKGYIPSYIAFQIYEDPWMITAVMAAPVIGHIFSAYLGLRGGKGIATLLGVLLPVLSLPQVILIFLVWGIAVKLVKIMSIVNIMYVLLVPGYLWLRFHHPAYVVFGLGIDLVIWYAHRSNIKRLLKGTELKLPI